MSSNVRPHIHLLSEALKKAHNFPSQPGHQANIYTLKTTCLRNRTICGNVIGLKEEGVLVFLPQDIKHDWHPRGRTINYYDDDDDDYYDFDVVDNDDIFILLTMDFKHIQHGVGGAGQ